ncbi:MAG: hypothetical protein PCFJNLEI_03762 [Verrucomicrobiae bacterium]|nr:hypothetical protein [Verrucomicrobiae bacterium]
MKIALVLSLLLIDTLALAQTQIWQVAIKSTDGIKETGFGYITMTPWMINNRTNLTGYVLTSRTFGVATIRGSAHISGNVFEGEAVESLNNQTSNLQITGKEKPSGIELEVHNTSDGRTFKVRGTPATALLDFSGNWSGIVKQDGLQFSEHFTATPSEFYGIYNIVGEISVYGGMLPASGQLITDNKGNLAGYTFTEIQNVLTSLTGKWNAKKQTAKVKGLTDQGSKLTGAFDKN